MTDIQEPMPPRQTAAETAFDIFQRIVAFYCLGAGLWYWSLLIGVYGGGAWRFDVLPSHWKAAVAILAVLWPVAGIGLWMLVSWGPVVWIVAAAAESLMYGGFSSLYGNYWYLLAIHCVVAVTYVILRLIIYFNPRSEMGGSNI